MKVIIKMTRYIGNGKYTVHSGLVYDGEIRMASIMVRGVYGS